MNDQLNFGSQSEVISLLSSSAHWVVGGLGRDSDLDLATSQIKTALLTKFQAMLIGLVVKATLCWSSLFTGEDKSKHRACWS